MKKILLSLLMGITAIQGIAQPTWSDDVAQVFYDNCTACHHTGGIGPMSLTTYAQASAYGALIQNYVTNNIMPPWFADSSYQHYAGERILTQSEKDIILDWISGGYLPGNFSQIPPPPVYTNDQVLSGTPDLVVTAPHYMSKANFVDDYVCFAIPSGLASGKKVKAIEVVPGNREIVHHCLVYFDNAGFSQTDTSGDCAGPITATLMGGYTPGSSPIIFPSTQNFSAGMQIGANCKIVLAMHYPAGSYGLWDETKINFYFYDEPVANFREVSCNPIIQDWNSSFVIDANQFDSTFIAEGPTTGGSSVLSVLPHMHLLGHSIQSYAVTGSNDTIPFVRIPNWNFDWQDFYWFNYMKYVPAGSTIYGKGVWNNTATNPHNPNSPPQDVQYGLNTTDEMFLIYFHYMDYQVGDEYINIDSIYTEFLSTHTELKSDPKLNVYPNPFEHTITISYGLDKASFVSIYIYDMQGRVVRKLLRENQSSGQQSVEWNGTNGLNEPVGAGIYFYSVMIDGNHYSGKLIRQ
ncbi:MAG: T9SS type A sorting domain-containing protein [Crocinitomicaceae bacterium]|nr:T9SS type A sorting domain-containing protein [Crocinitomicaceae bacterium]